MAQAAILTIQDLAHGDVVTIDLRFENFVMTHLARHPQIVGIVRKPDRRHRQRVLHDDIVVVLLGHARTVNIRSRLDLPLADRRNPIHLVSRAVRCQQRKRLLRILQQTQ